MEVQIKSDSIELVDIDLLIENPDNTNKHPPEQIERLAKIIKHSGFRNPLTVSRRSGFVIAGHGRIEAARSLQMNKLPVIYQDFENEAEEYAHLNADNEIAKWATTDLAMVNLKMLDFGPDFDIDLMGIKDFVIEPAEKFEPQADEDAVPDVVNPITRRGDVWLLGKHRLLCGDSTMIDDVEKLMAGEKVDMVFTDPPYGIGESNKDFKSREKLAPATLYEKSEWDNDIPSEDFFQILLGLGVPSYVFGGNYFSEFLPPSGSWIVWNKKNGSNDFSDCELAWSNHKNAVRYYEQTWNGMIREGETGKRVHPTQKPIALSEFCFNQVDNSKSVLDFYLGSGSTLIACEKTNRKCYGLELDEKYVDIIINRWQQYTGNKATLESTGQTYEELKGERDGQD